MKNRKHNLLFILLGVLLCLMPGEARAEEEDYQYEASFAFYKYDKNNSQLSSGTTIWESAIKTPSIAPLLGIDLGPIEDFSNYKAGDYLAISPTLKYIGNNPANATTFALYFYYNSDVLEPAPISPSIVFNNTAEGAGGDGVFPNANWKYETFQSLTHTDKGEMIVTFRDGSYPGNPFSSTSGKPFAYQVFRLKKDITSEDDLKLWYLTKKMVDNPEETDDGGYKLYTVGADNDGMIDVPVKTIDHLPAPKKSSVKTLSEVKIADSTNTYLNLTTESDLNNTTFNAIVPASVTTTNLTITPKDAKATIAKETVTKSKVARKVAGLGNQLMAMALAGEEGVSPLAANTLTDPVSLSTGPNTFKYTVTAEDETTETYTINILRLNDDASLSALSLSDSLSLTPTFPTATDDIYAATAPYTLNKVTITATATDATNATVTGAGEKNLSIGPNPFTVVVTPEACKAEYKTVPGNEASFSGNNCAISRTYTLNITKNAADTNTFLQSLTVSPGTLTNASNNGNTGFEKNDEQYTVTLGSSESAITINATPEASTSTVEIKKGTTVITNNTSTNVDPGDTTFTIKVTSESNASKTYTIKVTRQSNDSGLATLTVTNGSNTYKLDPTFTAGTTTTTFNTVVPPDINDVDINATQKVPSTVGLTGIGNKALTGDNTTLTFDSTAQDGTVTTYTINVKRLKGTATLDGITLTNGITLNPPFASGTTEYTINNVPYSTKTTDVSATVTPGEDSSITSGTGSWTLSNHGTTVNTKTIVVNAENCKTEYASIPGNICKHTDYKINIYRENPATNADLSGIDVTPYTLTNTSNNGNTGFNTNDLKYTVTVPSSVSSININATTADTNATVTGTGSKTLNTGSNPFNIVVTAEDGTTDKTYTVTVVRASNVATLNSLSISTTPTTAAGSLSPAFTANSAGGTYTYKYDETATSINITATSTHNKAKVQIGSDTAVEHTATSSIDPKTTNSITITVTPEDETASSETYIINFERKKSTVNTLKELHITDINNKEYITSFSPTTNTYNINVENEISSLTVNAVATSDSAKINGGTNTFTDTTTFANLGFSNNQLVITVSPEETTGSSETYTINVARKKSTNANLASLSVNGKTLNPVFDPETIEYTISDVNSSVEHLNISFTTENEFATAAIVTGTNDLTEGDNEVIIRVTPQSGSTKDYKIKVKKKSNNTSVTITATDNGATPGSLKDTSSGGNNTYTYIYPKDATEVTITATSTHGGSINLGDGYVVDTATKTFPVPTTTTVTIDTTSEEGTFGQYTITLEKALETEDKLKSLSVKDSSNKEYISSFNGSTKTYNITVPTEADKVTITAEALGEYATVKVDGKESPAEIGLNAGSNTVLVVVSPESGNSNTYTLNITREINHNATLTDLKVLDNGTDILPGFSSGTYTYNLTVDYRVEEVELQATAITDATVTASDLGTKSLNVGDNSFDINILAGDGTTPGKYTVNIHRKSNVSTITGITSSAGTINPDTEAEGDNVYTLTVSDTVTSVTLTPAFTHPQASVRNPNNLNNIDISTGNPIYFTVLAEDNNYTKEYQVNIVKQSSDNTLEKLEYNTVRNTGSSEITDPSVTATPEANGTTYKIKVPYGTTKVNITATPNNANASIDKAMPIVHTLSGNTGTETFVVTAEDGTDKTYTVEISIDPNTDTRLEETDGLKIFGKPATWVDDHYEVTVDPEDLELKPSDIEVKTKDTSATVNKGSGLTELAPNISGATNDYNIEVTAADGKTKVTYPVKISRNPSTDNTLEKIESTIGKVTDKGDGTYVITVPFGTTSLDVTATPNFVKTTTNITGAGVAGNTITIADLNNGEFTIDTMSENGDAGAFTVKVESLGLTPDPDDPSGDSTGLSVEGYTLNPTFNTTTLDYTLDKDVPASTNNLTVHAHASNPNTTIKYQLNSETETTNNVIDVSGVTGNNTIKVIIGSTLSSETITYTIAFNKLEKVGLTGLNITDNAGKSYNFTESFAEDKLSYTIDGDVAEDVTSLIVNTTTVGSVTLSYELNSAGASNNKTIDVSSVVGSNTIKVVVTPAGGTAITYTIAFNKATSEDDEKITSTVHEVDNLYVRVTIDTENPNLDVSKFITQFDNNPSNLHVYESDGTTEKTSGNVGTGMVIKLEKDGKILDQKTVVLYGDANGDGLIKVADAVAVMEHYLGEENGENQLAGPYFLAADMDADTELRIYDGFKIIDLYLSIDE